MNRLAGLRSSFKKSTVRTRETPLATLLLYGILAASVPLPSSADVAVPPELFQRKPGSPNTSIPKGCFMADFEQLKQKYQPVLDAITKEGAQLMNLNLDGVQLYLKATADSESSKDRIWDAIKKADPAFADLKHDFEVMCGRAEVDGAIRATASRRSPNISAETLSRSPSSPALTTSRIRI
jgi:hypothetical protein